MTLLSLRFIAAGGITALIARAAGVGWPVNRRAWARLFALGV